jgi:hypothetical protein
MKEARVLTLPQWSSIISVSVVPVVIISACGLLSLAFYGRLAALVARLRTFQREMLREQEKWAREGLQEQQLLIEVLRTQIIRVTERARLIRRALIFFLSAVAVLVVCSLALIISRFFPSVALFAAVFFALGLLSMLSGVISAMLEFRDSLEQVAFEGRFVIQAVEPSVSESHSDSD